MGIAVGMEALAAEKVVEVVRVDWVGTAQREVSVEGFEVAENFTEQRGAVSRTAEELAERNRVGGIALKVGLVHVHPHSGKGGGNGVAREGVFEEHAAELPLAHVDVVRPLHRGFHAEGAERADNGE